MSKGANPLPRRRINAGVTSAISARRWSDAASRYQSIRRARQNEIDRQWNWQARLESSHFTAGLSGSGLSTLDLRRRLVDIAVRIDSRCIQTTCSVYYSQVRWYIYSNCYSKQVKDSVQPGACWKVCFILKSIYGCDIFLSCRSIYFIMKTDQFYN